MNKQINCSVNGTDYISFQTMFPQMLSRFVRRAIRRAIEDKDFFSDVCFSPLKSEIDLRFDALRARAYPDECEVF